MKAKKFSEDETKKKFNKLFAVITIIFAGCKNETRIIKKSYTITFDANGGNGDEYTDSIEVTSDITLYAQWSNIFTASQFFKSYPNLSNNDYYNPYSFVIIDATDDDLAAIGKMIENT